MPIELLSTLYTEYRDALLVVIYDHVPADKHSIYLQFIYDVMGKSNDEIYCDDEGWMLYRHYDSSPYVWHNNIDTLLRTGRLPTYQDVFDFSLIDYKEYLDSQMRELANYFKTSEKYAIGSNCHDEDCGFFDNEDKCCRAYDTCERELYYISSDVDIVELLDRNVYDDAMTIIARTNF